MEPKFIRLHNLDDYSSRDIYSIEDCQNEHEKIICQTAFEMQDVITMGTSIAEPIYQ